MGVRLVQYVCGPFWAHLDPAPRLLLATMAAGILDDDKGNQPAARYFRARQELVLAYAGITEDDPKYESAERRIRRHITTLLDAGAIRQISVGRRGRHAEYELTVNPLEMRNRT